MRYLICFLGIGFIIVDYAFTINPIIRNSVFAIMAFVAIAYLVKNKKENGLDSMFKEENKETKSIFNIKDLFRK